MFILFASKNNSLVSDQFVNFLFKLQKPIAAIDTITVTTTHKVEKLKRSAICIPSTGANI